MIVGFCQKSVKVKEGANVYQVWIQMVAHQEDDKIEGIDSESFDSTTLPINEEPTPPNEKSRPLWIIFKYPKIMRIIRVIMGIVLVNQTIRMSFKWRMKIARI